jgi:hypothetical protein
LLHFFLIDMSPLQRVSRRRQLTVATLILSTQNGEDINREIIEAWRSQGNREYARAYEGRISLVPSSHLAMDE